MKSTEKLLIFALVAVIVIVCGYKFLISPSLVSMSEAGSDYLSYSAKLDEANTYITMTQQYNDEFKKQKDNSVSLSNKFFPELYNDKVHIFLEHLTSKAALTTPSFNITDAVSQSVVNSTTSKVELQYDAKDFSEYIDSYIKDKSNIPPQKSSTATTSATKDDSNNIEMMKVIIKFSDSYEKTLQFLKEIKSCGRNARVEYCQILKEGDKLSTTINIECYGVKKFVPDNISEDNLRKAEGKANPFY